MPMWARESCLVDDVKLITLEDDLINQTPRICKEHVTKRELTPADAARQRKNQSRENCPAIYVELALNRVCNYYYFVSEILARICYLKFEMK